MDAVVAVYSDWGIGANGTQPVVIPEDRKHFVELTRGAAVIVGRKTLEDFPGGRPLPKRLNIVLTKQDIQIDGALVAHSVKEALKLAADSEKVMVLGGESVYSEFFPHIDRVFVTKIECKPHSDAFFPDLDANATWSCTERSELLMSGDIPYSFRVYERE